MIRFLLIKNTVEPHQAQQCHTWLREWAFLLAFCKAIYRHLQLMLCKNLRSPLKICGATHIFQTLLQIPLNKLSANKLKSVRKFLTLLIFSALHTSTVCQNTVLFLQMLFSHFRPHHIHYNISCFSKLKNYRCNCFFFNR